MQSRPVNEFEKKAQQELPFFLRGSDLKPESFFNTPNILSDADQIYYMSPARIDRKPTQDTEAQNTLLTRLPAAPKVCRLIIKQTLEDLKKLQKEEASSK
jgi:hypothetical protein